MARAATKPASTDTDAVEKAPKAKRPLFPKDKALNGDGNAVALDDKGRLTGVPENWDASYRKFSKKDFADLGHYFEWLATLEQRRITSVQSKIKDLYADAEQARKGPDPVNQVARKVKKMLANIEKARAEMKAQDIDIDAVIAGM